MERPLIHPPLEKTFDEVFKAISNRPRSRTPQLRSNGDTPFFAEAKWARDGRRFISLPHNNRIYEGDWGHRSNSMGRNGQRIGQYSKPLDEWAKRI